MDEVSLSPDQDIKGIITQAIDSEREEFRKYLENGGVLELITRVLKDLYELKPRPADPLLYFVYKMEVVQYTTKEYAAYKEEIIREDELKRLNNSLINK